MISIKVIDRVGETHILEAPTDMNMNLMELCKAYELPVAGTCGGMALCSTCHVYVESENPLSEMTDDEIAMLDSSFFVQNNSRLGCQLQLSGSTFGARERQLASSSHFQILDKSIPHVFVVFFFTRITKICNSKNGFTG